MRSGGTPAPLPPGQTTAPSPQVTTTIPSGTAKSSRPAGSFPPDFLSASSFEPYGPETTRFVFGLTMY